MLNEGVNHDARAIRNMSLSLGAAKVLERCTAHGGLARTERLGAIEVELRRIEETLLENAQVLKRPARRAVVARPHISALNEAPGVDTEPAVNGVGASARANDVDRAAGKGTATGHSSRRTRRCKHCAASLIHQS